MDEVFSGEAFFEHYSRLVRADYGDQPHIESFISEMKLAFHWTISRNDCKCFTSSNGCIMLFHEDATKDQINFGFFRVPEQSSEANALWQKVIQFVRKAEIPLLSGPIQGTTYFPYRFVSETDHSPFFKGEYFNPVSACHFLDAQSPSKILKYRSGYRDHFEGIMAVSKPYFDKAMDEGFRVVKHAKVTNDLFKRVFNLIGKVFGGNWSFQQLSEDELAAIYHQEFSREVKLALHTFYWKNELIGFCRYIENDHQTLICKTLGFLPEYHGKGLGNAAVYQMHKDALDCGYNRMIYALIYDENRVQKNMPKDDSVIFRKYRSYEFELS